MSYIRSTSNPESLYIWGDARGRINVWHRVPPPLSSRASVTDDDGQSKFQVPLRVFDHACRAWAKNGEGPVRYRGLSIEEELVYLDTGKVVPKRERTLLWMDAHERRPQAILVCVSYQRKGSRARHFVRVWLVTWRSVVANATCRGPKKRARQRR